MSFYQTILGAQKNWLVETVLLTTYIICFGWEIKKIIFKLDSYLEPGGMIQTNQNSLKVLFKQWTYLIQDSFTF